MSEHDLLYAHGLSSQASSPVTLEAPIGTHNARHFRAKVQANFVRGANPGLPENRVVFHADAAASAINFWRRRAGNFCATLFIEWISLRERHDLSIRAGAHSGLLLLDRLHSLRFKIRQVANLDRLGRGKDVADRGSAGDRGNAQFRDRDPAASCLRTWTIDLEFHSFGQAITLPAVKINGAIGDVLDAKLGTRSC